MHAQIESLIQKHLTELVEHIGTRPTGSAGNQQAGAYLQQHFADAGWQVETPLFVCLTWESGGAQLTSGSDSFTAQVNPYSPTFAGERPFVACSTVEELEAQGDLRGRFVVLTGDLSADSFMPLNFPFASFEEQARIIRQLMSAQPDAVIGFHPKPLFCDAEFPLPSVTVMPSDAPRLLEFGDRPLTLTIQSRVIPSTGYNVIARSPHLTAPKTVVCAHYDTWFETPGAVDNAAGVSVLLTLASLLNPAASNVEFVAFNGEDHYAAPGSVSYLKSGLANIELVINVDGVGARDHQNSIAYFDEATAGRIGAIQQHYPAIVTADPWYQSDHTLFLLQGIPAVAMTSSPFDAWLERTHTLADTLDGIDTAKITEAVCFIRDIASG